MRGFGFSSVDTDKVLNFVNGHGLQEVGGMGLVAAIEKALGGRVE